MGKSRSVFQQFLRQLLNFLFGLVEGIAHWVFSKIYGGNTKKIPPIEDKLLLESASEIALKIRTGKITSEQVLDKFIDRIKATNPILNAVVADRFQEARKEAKAVDDVIRSGAIPVEKLAIEKPFFGVPFTTKDCIPIKGLIHSSGLVRRKHIVAEEDAKVVASLREAGAIPIGLTNVSELCMWWESSNKVHGRTNNPYDVTRIVGGSSGGEGCAQGAALSAFGVGSDIGGSIRMPSFFNGVFGHKPSPFVVPNHGQYPAPITDEQMSFLGLGPMCRKSEDLLPLLKIMVEKDKLQQLKLDQSVDVKKLRYFLQDHDTKSFLVSSVAEDILNLFPRIVGHLDEGLGAKVTKLDIKKFGNSAPIWFGNMKSPSGPTFQEQLANLDGAINPYLELLKFIFGQSNHTFIAICTAIADKSGCKHGDETHQYLVKARNELKKELCDLLGDDGVFIYPTHPTPAPYHNEPIFKAFNFSYTGIINVLGLPATHIPMGLDREGLPIGIQVVATPNNDRLCIAVARELDRAFGGWVPPHTP